MFNSASGSLFELTSLTGSDGVPDMQIEQVLSFSGQLMIMRSAEQILRVASLFEFSTDVHSTRVRRMLLSVQFCVRFTF